MDRFIKRKGYKDGIIGFYISLLITSYKVAYLLKYELMEKIEITILKEL